MLVAFVTTRPQSCKLELRDGQKGKITNAQPYPKPRRQTLYTKPNLGGKAKSHILVDLNKGVVYYWPHNFPRECAVYWLQIHRCAVGGHICKNTAYFSILCTQVPYIGHMMYKCTVYWLYM